LKSKAKVKRNKAKSEIKQVKQNESIYNGRCIGIYGQEGGLGVDIIDRKTVLEETEVISIENAGRVFGDGEE
jgi:hypothetical protein